MTFLMRFSSILASRQSVGFFMAVSGLWMLVVFYGIVYALLHDFNTDFFVLLGVAGALAFVLSK